MTEETLMDQVAVTLDEREQPIENTERNNYLVRGSDLGAIQKDESWKKQYNYATFKEYLV